MDSLVLCALGGWGGARGEVKVSETGGGRRSAERAGGTGTSEKALEDSKGLLIPRPVLT